MVGSFSLSFARRSFLSGFWRIYRKHDARMNLRSGLYSYLFEFDLEAVGMHPCLDTDVEIPHFGGIPQIALCFGKRRDQVTKPGDGGVGVFCIPGQFEMGAVRSLVASCVEYENLLAQRRYERLKIRRRVDVQIDIEKLSGC